MKVRIFIVSLIFLGATYGWASGNVQLNGIIHQITYPFDGGTGTDYLQFESSGVGLRINQGNLVTGMLNIAALFPYDTALKDHPNGSFVRSKVADSPFLLDGLLGAGYTIDLSVIDFFIGGGFHFGLLFLDNTRIISYGVGMDAQALIRWGKAFTMSAGVYGSLDFDSDSTVKQGKTNGLIWGLGFSFGISVSY